MKEIRINVSQIAYVKIFRKVIDRSWQFIPEKKFWFHTRKAGFRLSPNFDSGIWTPEQIENQNNLRFVEGENVYYKPHIELHMSDGSQQNKWFKTVEELEKFLLDYSGSNWITK